jgi:hypothetical protein
VGGGGAPQGGATLACCASCWLLSACSGCYLLVLELHCVHRLLHLLVGRVLEVQDALQAHERRRQSDSSNSKPAESAAASAMRALGLLGTICGGKRARGPRHWQAHGSRTLRPKAMTWRAGSAAHAQALHPAHVCVRAHGIDGIHLAARCKAHLGVGLLEAHPPRPAAPAPLSAPSHCLVSARARVTLQPTRPVRRRHTRSSTAPRGHVRAAPGRGQARRERTRPSAGARGCRHPCSS